MGNLRSGSFVPGFRRLILLVALLLAGLTPLAGTLAQESGEPVSGGTLRVALSEEPPTLDPAKTNLLVASWLQNHIFDRLVYFGEDRTPQPWLAESWEISEDNRTVTFTLREGISFTDGTPLDAAAVKANFDRHLDPAVTSFMLSGLGSLETVDAPDARTVVLNFAEPYAPIFTTLSGLDIYSPTALETMGEDAFGRAPVGSGPFILTQWDANTLLRFERNPDYVNYRTDDLNSGPAYLDVVEVYILPEAATQAAAFEAGEIDILNPSQEDLARLAADPGVQIEQWEDATNLNFVEYVDEAPYNNLAFRQAISYAINRDQLIELAHGGYATANQCPLALGNTGYNGDLCAEHGSVYDPEWAKQALADAGWTDSDGDGFVEIEGVEGPLTFYTYGPYDVQTASVELIQADLQAIGLDVEIRVLETAALEQAIESGEVGFWLTRWTYPDPVVLSLLYMSPGWIGGNLENDPELDALLTVADQTLEPAERQVAVDAAMAHILDNAVMTPLVTDWIQVAVRPNVNDYHWDASGGERFIDIWLEQ